MKLSKEEFIAKMTADQQRILAEKKEQDRQVRREYGNYMWDNYVKMHRKSRWPRKHR